MSNWIGNSIVEKSIDKLGRYLQSSPGTYFFLFALLIYLFLGTLEADPDLFARIAMGRWLEKFGSFPIKDPFSFTSTKAIWIDHEWLSGVVFYRIVSAFGDVGLFIFKIILSLLTIGILNATVKKSSSRSLSLFLLFIFANELSVVWMSTVRSQIFTYLFIPIFLYLITIHKKFQDKTLLFLSPLIMALWCNLHGGFVVGLGILGAYSFAKIVLRQSGAVPVFFSFVASIFSTLLNPYGFSYWKFMFMALSMPRVTITEWAGASFLDPAHLIFWIFITISIWQLIKNRKSLPLEGSLLLIVCAYGAISHIRFSSVFLMMFIIYIAPQIDYFWENQKSLFSSIKLKRVCILSAVFCMIFFWILSFKTIFIRNDKFLLSFDSYPVNALNWLKQYREGGDLLVDFNNGSFALWRLYPDFKISLDGRYEEVYEDHTLVSVNCAMNPSCPEHLNSLSLINPHFILVLTKTISSNKFDSNWSEIYRDDSFFILEKSSKKESQPLMPIRRLKDSDHIFSASF